MDRDKIKSILEQAFKTSKKTPSLFQLPKILHIKQQLESAQSISQLISLLEQHKTFIQSSLDISDSHFIETLKAIKSLET